MMYLKDSIHQISIYFNIPKLKDIPKLHFNQIQFIKHQLRQYFLLTASINAVEVTVNAYLSDQLVNW
jgi:hypothetical protein